ncbi:hypothetical protein ON010_g10728 [Phytophthora cinnamomi]|nr:hypothetical protein ON010_g10728 [Phytophthora cinnamomi]
MTRRYLTSTRLPHRMRKLESVLQLPRPGFTSTAAQGIRTPPLIPKSPVKMSPKRHKHSRKKRKTLKMQVQELQTTVDKLQAQVNDAASRIQQIKQLLVLYVEHRKPHYEEMKREAEEQRRLEQHELDMNIEEQQRQLQAQIKREYEQYLYQQEIQEVQIRLQQQYLGRQVRQRDEVTK